MKTPFFHRHRYRLILRISIGFILLLTSGAVPHARATEAQATAEADLNSVRTALRVGIESDILAFLSREENTLLLKRVMAAFAITPESMCTEDDICERNHSPTEVVSHLSKFILADLLADPSELNGLPLLGDATTLNRVLRDPQYAKVRELARRHVDATLQRKDFANRLEQTVFPKVRTQLVGRLFEGDHHLRAVACGDSLYLHGRLTETTIYDTASGDIRICARTILTGDATSLVSTLTRTISIAAETASNQRSPASMESMNGSNENLEALPVLPPSNEDEDSSRSPAAASAKNAAKGMKNAKTAKNEKNAKHTEVSQNQTAKRLTRLPSSVADGVEYRMQYGKLVSTFWVAKRADRRELVFANSSGSRVATNISPENFHYLHTTAQMIPSGPRTDLSKCQGQSIQMIVVAAGQPERSVASCLRSTDKRTDELRGFGNLLAAMVR